MNAGVHLREFLFVAASALLADFACAALCSPADEVDTRIGSRVGNGSCIIGPCVPHGSVLPGPDTVWPSEGRKFPPPNGYWHGDKVVGFSQLHCQGTGGTPTYGLFRLVFGEPSAIEFLETHPYRLKARLVDIGTTVTVSATENGAVYAYDGKDPELDFRCKVGLPVATSNAWMKAEGDALFGGGTYFGNWNPAPYDCWFYATRGKGVCRIAVSFASVEEARRFHDAELAGRSVDEVAGEARRLWDRRLSRIEIDGVDAAERSRFYTHLFHAFVQPRRRGGVWDDHYTLWDTWKTQFPLLAMIEPETAADIVNSFARRLGKSGRCEAAFIQGKEMRVGQGGNDADNVIAHAVLNGVPGIDVEAAWKVLAAHASDRTADYRERGWVASDAPHDYCWRLRSASSTLAFAYNDACAARVAERLGKTKEAAILRTRSMNWTNVWDEALVDAKGGFRGFAKGRRADGTFGAREVWSGEEEPYDPRSGYNGSFYEGTSWEYSFNAWHDIPGLIAKCGGRERFVARLEYALGNGLIDFGNEPSFYTPWLFSLAGRPDLTRKWAREVVKMFPSDGCPGDDDSGAMGAFYVFLKLGFLPIAGSDLVISHGTMYPRVVLHLPGGDRVLGAMSEDEKEVR